MRYLFQVSTLKSLKFLPGFDGSKVTEMSYLFCYTQNIEYLVLNYFKTNNVVNMNQMFCNSQNLIYQS